MNRFIGRMADLDFRVIPPAETTREPSSNFRIDDIRKFRTEVFGEFGFLPTNDASVDDADPRSWHVLALRKSQLVGCIRLTVFNPEQVHDMPQRTIANSRGQFSEPDHSRCLAALAAYAFEWIHVGGPLVQAGTLAVARRARKSIVAPALCLAVNALSRLLRAKSGIVFAVERTGGASLYAKAGCVPLRLGNADLGYLSDSYHCDRVLPMSWDPRRVEPDLEDIVDSLCARLHFAVTQPEVSHA